LRSTLEYLDLSHTNVTEAELEVLAGFDKLKTLKLRDLKNITGKCFPSFTCKGLINLDISSSEISGENFAHIFQVFPELSSLAFRNNGLSDGDLKGISRLEHLSHLDLSWSKNLSGSCIKEMSALPFLQILDLSNSEHLSPTSKFWKNFQSLTILNLASTPVTNATCAQLAELPMLSSLSIAYAEKVTAKGVQSLTLLDHLQYLDLAFCEVEEGVSQYFPPYVEIRF
jgi:hypothetical protein